MQVTQGDRAILDAAVWSVASNDGLEHRDTTAPDVPGPEALGSMEELVPDQPSVYAFWDNVDMRPVDFRPDWPPPEPLSPVWQAWCRFRPTATFDDPWVDGSAPWS